MKIRKSTIIEMTKRKLIEAKSNNIKVIAADYDGTLYDRNDKNYNSLLNILSLAYKVTNKNIEFAFVSGRNTTLQVELRKLIPLFCKTKKCNLRIWHSGGNGMNLYKISYHIKTKKLYIKKIFSNTLSVNEILKIIAIYDNLQIEADSNSQNFFNAFLKNKLPNDLIPKRYVQLTKKYKGKIFAESVKVSLVLPTQINAQKKYIHLLKKQLVGTGLNVGWGGIPFADISKELKYNNKVIDGKLLMAKNIISKLKILKNQIVTFGDTPLDNNKGLLSLPFSFTNDVTLQKKKLSKPPFILQIEDSPIKAVYDAISFLIS